MRAALLRWFDANQRKMPWRETRDPYAIWISETMLQQTRVETVIPYYERFLARFPDVEALSSADRDEVLEHWAGLGYYSRARNLHDAAKQMSRDHGGRVPEDRESLLSLSGVGRYTAGAVASIAFDRPEPVVDGNVARVFARYFGIREEIRRTGVQKRLWQEAEAWVEGPRPGDFNQALMELGATLCVPRAPRCLACPLAPGCSAHGSGDAESLPVKAKKKQARAVRAACAWLQRGGRVLMVRRPSEGLLGGMWDLPGGELAADDDDAAALARHLDARLGFRDLTLEPVGEVEHVFTHRHLRLSVFRGSAPAGRTRRRGFDAHRWLAPERLAELATATVTRKALALASRERGLTPGQRSEPRSDDRAEHAAGAAGPR